MVPLLYRDLVLPWRGQKRLWHNRGDLSTADYCGIQKGRGRVATNGPYGGRVCLIGSSVLEVEVRPSYGQS